LISRVVTTLPILPRWGQTKGSGVFSSRRRGKGVGSLCFQHFFQTSHSNRTKGAKEHLDSSWKHRIHKCRGVDPLGYSSAKGGKKRGRETFLIARSETCLNTLLRTDLVLTPHPSRLTFHVLSISRRVARKQRGRECFLITRPETRPNTLPHSDLFLAPHPSRLTTF